MTIITKKRINQLTFNIIGAPVAKGRPRFYRGSGFVGTYTPDNTRRWENIVRGQAISYRPKELWKGPISMALTFLMPRPKSLPKKVIHHIKKPDLDNLAKAIKDALQGVIYKTDSQVVVLNLDKKYTIYRPGVIVTVEELV